MASTVPNIWYWAACALFVITSGLIIYLIKKQDVKLESQGKDIQEINKCSARFSGSCEERHKAITQSLAAGRKRFSTMEEDIKDILKGDD